MFGGMSAQG